MTEGIELCLSTRRRNGSFNNKFEVDSLGSMEYDKDFGGKKRFECRKRKRRMDGLMDRWDEMRCLRLYRNQEIRNQTKRTVKNKNQNAVNKPAEIRRRTTYLVKPVHKVKM